MHSTALALAPAALSSASVRPRRGAALAPAIISSASGRPRRGARNAVRCEVASSSAPSAAATQAAKWAQRTVLLPAQRRGCHLITPQIVNEIKDDLAEFKCGMAHLFSACKVYAETIISVARSLTNYQVPFAGPDDMPAHIKSSMFGSSLTIPITNGRLNTGYWQGIWLCEHRDHATPRQIVITLNGI
ncbi:unnamed protein product [Urochloa decumbens]|uniref:Uncharacterized protein n=1 Tax=Urochloa decumbens TaxID=240449 RepID=A0ABC9EAA9_9POAL